MSPMVLITEREMQKKVTPVEQLSYEQAFAELETIVGALEANQITLEESLALFERGQALSKYCAGLLDRAELRVSQLTGIQPDRSEEEFAG
jgi:exodeoxyribonuclease VII small subunit